MDDGTINLQRLHFVLFPLVIDSLTRIRTPHWSVNVGHNQTILGKQIDMKAARFNEPQLEIEEVNHLCMALRENCL
jgi:hypothetical protein